MYTCDPYIHVLPSTDLESTVLQECYAPGVTEFFCPMDDAPRKTVWQGCGIGSQILPEKWMFTVPMFTILI
jgi:hypothetical protein